VTGEGYLVTQRVELLRERDSNTLNINQQRERDDARRLQRGYVYSRA
jgi:hypothetical protein